MSYYTTMETPFGELVLTSNGKALTGIYPASHHEYTEVKKVHALNEHPFKETRKQLKEYFAGKRKKFDLPLAAQGTVFQKNVWKQLSAIPFGKTKSYGEVAKEIRSPKASRAVGAANGSNPICIIVPCHRVIGANGKLTGYAGGLKMKEWLLKHEQSIN